ncbi:hypothetical protein BU23DRAFT_563469 [Bimuria novae-zelandiae CBS 107.79]|uniref:F-box domain-containing protein n=1 Tax=Bimuria novae-zelandiae CBS 107.79 TaxID=1447943 RepID=A0A6A5W1I1_9PLEO|nr:hypothetical protein BU23DRAFT_563469 [Bimuria novae-zelandiae CBS 107.79]
MSFPLTVLPEELITTVVSHVSDRGALCNLALASRQLHRLATPHLYNDIAVYLGKEPRDHEALRSLVTGLLERPDYAACVQHLEIRGHWINILEPDEQIDKIFFRILKEKIKALKTHVWINENIWADAITGLEREEALVVILLLISPNLRTLNTIAPPRSGKYWLWLMKRISNQSPGALLKLRELALLSAESDRESCFPFLQLPNLKSVLFYGFYSSREGWNIYDDDGVAYLADAASAISAYCAGSAQSTVGSVEHLEIFHAGPLFPTVLQMIGSCATLRTFAFDHSDWMVPENPSLYNAVVLALSIHADSLTALHIGDKYNGHRTHGKPLDFRGLYNLRLLKIPISGFLGFSDYTDESQSLSDDRMRERFPISLQELVLLCDRSEEPHVLPTLQHYIHAWPHIIPNMESLEIHCHAPEAMYAWLRQPTERRHIQLRIFRKLNVSGKYRFVAPFVSSIKDQQQDISSVEIEVEDLTNPLDDLMPVEEFIPAEESLVTSFEEDLAQLSIL